MNKLKHIPLLVIIVGIIITCYGSWKIIDSHMKTNHSLEEAKKCNRTCLGKERNKKRCADTAQKRISPRNG